MKCGLFTLGDHVPDPHSGEFEGTQAERHEMWIDLGTEGERLGFDGYWLGEHHFNSYILSCPQMVLAAVASRTRRIRLGTAVTLIAHHDPVLLAEQFSTLDLISNGRAEIGFSSGLTPESYRLFGQNPDDALAIQNEKIELLQRLWDEDVVHWRGEHRPPFDGGRLEPRTFSGKSIPICIGTATPQRVESLARSGYKLMIPSIFGSFGQFREVIELYRETYLAAGHDPARMEVCAPVYVHVREDGQDAWEYMKPYLANYRHSVGLLAEKEKLTRGILDLRRRMTEQQNRLGEEARFRRDCDIAGTPDEVVAQLRSINANTGNGIDTLMCYFDYGGMPAREVMASVDLFGKRVMPHLL